MKDFKTLVGIARKTCQQTIRNIKNDPETRILLTEALPHSTLLDLKRFHYIKQHSTNIPECGYHIMHNRPGERIPGIANNFTAGMGVLFKAIDEGEITSIALVNFNSDNPENIAQSRESLSTVASEFKDKNTRIGFIYNGLNASNQSSHAMSLVSSAKNFSFSPLFLIPPYIRNQICGYHVEDVLKKEGLANCEKDFYNISKSSLIAIPTIGIAPEDRNSVKVIEPPYLYETLSPILFPDTSHKQLGI